jgi:hypothetical protein
MYEPEIHQALATQSPCLPGSSAQPPQLFRLMRFGDQSFGYLFFNADPSNKSAIFGDQALGALPFSVSFSVYFWSCLFFVSFSFLFLFYAKFKKSFKKSSDF